MNNRCYFFLNACYAVFNWSLKTKMILTFVIQSFLEVIILHTVSPNLWFLRLRSEKDVSLIGHMMAIA